MDAFESLHHLESTMSALRRLDYLQKTSVRAYVFAPLVLEAIRCASGCTRATIVELVTSVEGHDVTIHGAVGLRGSRGLRNLTDALNLLEREGFITVEEGGAGRAHHYFPKKEQPPRRGVEQGGRRDEPEGGSNHTNPCPRAAETPNTKTDTNKEEGTP